MSAMHGYRYGTELEEITPKDTRPAAIKYQSSNEPTAIESALKAKGQTLMQIVAVYPTRPSRSTRRRTAIAPTGYALVPVA